MISGKPPTHIHSVEVVTSSASQSVIVPDHSKKQLQSTSGMRTIDLAHDTSGTRASNGGRVDDHVRTSANESQVRPLELVIWVPSYQGARREDTRKGLNEFLETAEEGFYRCGITPTCLGRKGRYVRPQAVRRFSKGLGHHLL